MVEVLVVTPRNLRKPTPRRVRFWWSEFYVMWRTLGVVVAMEDDMLDELEAK